MQYMRPATHTGMNKGILTLQLGTKTHIFIPSFLCCLRSCSFLYSHKEIYKVQQTVTHQEHQVKQDVHTTGKVTSTLEQASELMKRGMPVSYRLQLRVQVHVVCHKLEYIRKICWTFKTTTQYRGHSAIFLTLLQYTFK